MSGTILVVDDDPALQFTLSTLLEDEGYQVAVAGDGLEALDSLDGSTPNLILLDIAMPRMDGFAFVEQLSSRGLRQGIPIVVLTADGRAPQKAAQIGADGYLAKPFELTALLSQVARLAPP